MNMHHVLAGAQRPEEESDPLAPDFQAVVNFLTVLKTELGFSAGAADALNCWARFPAPQSIFFFLCSSRCPGTCPLCRPGCIQLGIPRLSLPSAKIKNMPLLA